MRKPVAQFSKKFQKRSDHLKKLTSTIERYHILQAAFVVFMLLALFKNAYLFAITFGVASFIFYRFSKINTTLQLFN